jgi:hypothetical protein
MQMLLRWAAVLAAICLVGSAPAVPLDQSRFLIVLDAGSTGTRAHVYTW